MSPLTKAFVVLVTVLSVLLVALVVPYVAQTEDYESQISLLKSEKQSAELSASIATEKNSAMAEREQEIKSRHSQQIEDLTKERIRLQTERDNAKAEAVQYQRELAQLNAELSRLSAAAVQDANLLTVTNADLKQTRQGLIDAQTKLVQLGDRNNELESQRDSLNRQVRQLSEKMVSLEQGNLELRGILAKVPPPYREQISTGEAPQIPQPATTPIAGTITDVQSAAGTQLVQVDVGTKDGVQENMKFLVHRNDQYLGTFVVDRVESAIAAGRITLSKGSIQAGDKIYTGPY